MKTLEQLTQENADLVAKLEKAHADNEELNKLLAFKEMQASSETPQMPIFEYKGNVLQVAAPKVRYEFEELDLLEIAKNPMQFEGILDRLIALKSPILILKS